MPALWRGAAAWGRAAQCAIASFLGGRFVQTIVVDTVAGTHSLLWDDLKHYINTHDVNLPPVGYGDKW